MKTKKYWMVVKKDGEVISALLGGDTKQRAKQVWEEYNRTLIEQHGKLVEVLEGCWKCRKDFKLKQVVVQI